MAKCDRRPFASNALPDAAVHRRILSACLCGASYPRRRRLRPPPPPEGRRGGGSDRLRDLLLVEEARGVVAALRAADGERQRRAAAEVRRMARGDPEARARLAAAGAVGPLVEMAVGDTEGHGSGDECDDDRVVEALYALLNLGIGDDANKAAIMQAGALERILTLISSNPSPPVSEAIAAILLSLSALDSGKSPIGSSSAVPFLVTVFQTHHQQQARHDSLRALFNLSLSPSNAAHLTSHSLVPSLLSSLEDLDLGDRPLAVLSNLVSSPHGRTALRSSPGAYPILVDVLGWADSPGCQEKAAYVLMIMAHKADAGDRAAMAEAGVVSPLLELMLVGSALAQQRAARVLERLRAEKGKQVSEGFEGRGNGAMAEVGEGEAEEGVVGEERRAVRELVRQSLQSNMRRMVSRANLQCNFAASDRFLSLGGTSRSFPL